MGPKRVRKSKEEQKPGFTVFLEDSLNQLHKEEKEKILSFLQMRKKKESKKKGHEKPSN